MLMLLTVAEAELPALSVHVPVRDWFVPSVLTTWEKTEGGTTPEVASAQVNVTVTSVLFHPAALASGAREPLTTGGVISRLMVTETEFDMLAPFVAKQV